MGQTLSEPVVDKVGEKRLNQVRCLETPLFPSPHTASHSERDFKYHFPSRFRCRTF
jgi:hypothetical protein